MTFSPLQAVGRESRFSRLDFRTKLVLVLVLTVLAFIWESPIMGGALSALVIVACFAVGVKRDYLFGLLKVLIPLYAFLLISMGFFNVAQVKALTRQEMLTPLLTLPETLFWIGGAQMSVEGTLYGLNIAFKTLSMVLALPLAVFTTDINNMILALVQAKIPYKIVFVFSSTLRFVPLLFAELQSIIEAQRLRGLDLDRMNLLKRLQVYASVAVPLILGAMLKSQKLEVVLQSKAFSGSGDRTYLHKSELTSLDYGVMVGALVTFAIALFAYLIWGIGTFAWLLYP